MKDSVYVAVHRSEEGWRVCDGYPKSVITHDPRHAPHPCQLDYPRGWIKVTGTFEVIPCPVPPPLEKEVIEL